MHCNEHGHAATFFGLGAYCNSIQKMATNMVAMRAGFDHLSRTLFDTDTQGVGHVLIGYLESVSENRHDNACFPAMIKIWHTTGLKVDQGNQKVLATLYFKKSTAM